MIRYDNVFVMARMIRRTQPQLPTQGLVVNILPHHLVV